MNDTLSDLAAELAHVEDAIHDAPLYADPCDPSAGFSEELIDLAVREERMVERLIASAVAQQA